MKASTSAEEQGARRPYSHSQKIIVRMADRIAQVEELRRAGKSRREIAQILGLSPGVVGPVISKLIAQGRIERKKDLKMDSRREEAIILMARRGDTYKDIGITLKTSRVRAGELIQKIAERRGEGVFKPGEGEQIWTAPSVARMLGVGVDLVRQLCSAGKIPCKRRGNAKGSRYLIGEEGIEVLLNHPRVAGVPRKFSCCICGLEFSQLTQGKARRTCSDECRRERLHSQRLGYPDQKLDADSLPGWHKELWIKLQSRRLLENEKWITIGQASQMTGLSKMRVYWLGFRKIVTIRPHPEKKYRGRQMATFAASEMKIAREVFESYQRQKLNAAAK